MSLFSKDDEIQFWSRQLAEHALFLQLGLTDYDLKKKASLFVAKWQTAPQWKADVGFYVAAIDELVAFKEEVLQKQLSGEFTGWLFPLFIDHIRREALYFRKMLTEAESDLRQSLCTFLVFMFEHAQFAAHLLDPTESEKIEAALKVSSDFISIVNTCQTETMEALVSLSKKEGEALDRYMGTLSPQVKSVIHPVLAAHVVREGKRFLATLEALKVSL